MFEDKQVKLLNEVCPICKQPFGLYLDEPKCSCAEENGGHSPAQSPDCPRHGLSDKAVELRENPPLVGSYLGSVFLQCPNAPRHAPHFILADGVSADGYTLERLVEALVQYNQEHEKG